MDRSQKEEHGRERMGKAVMDLDDLTGSDVWKLVYEECWRMWREAFDKLRKAEDGKGAERAKQMMDDSERLLRVPLRNYVKGSPEAKKRYLDTLSSREHKVLKEVFKPTA